MKYTTVCCQPEKSRLRLGASTCYCGERQAGVAAMALCGVSGSSRVTNGADPNSSTRSAIAVALDAGAHYLQAKIVRR